MFFFFVLKQEKVIAFEGRTKKEKVAAFEDQAIVPGQDLEKSNSFQSKNATIEVIYSIDIS